MEPKYFTTAEIMARFGVTRDRVSKMARYRKWRFIEVAGRGNTRTKLYLAEDVEIEAQRRAAKDLPH